MSVLAVLLGVYMVGFLGVACWSMKVALRLTPNARPSALVKFGFRQGLAWPFTFVGVTLLQIARGGKRRCR